MRKTAKAGTTSATTTAAAPSEEDLKNIEQLPEEDRQAAKAQAICPVTGPRWFDGVPVKITLRGKPVYLCCKGCIGKPARSRRMLKKLEGKTP